MKQDVKRKLLGGLGRKIESYRSRFFNERE
jgi:hypothetical protein